MLLLRKNYYKSTVIGIKILTWRKSHNDNGSIIATKEACNGYGNNLKLRDESQATSLKHHIPKDFKTPRKNKNLGHQKLVSSVVQF